MFKILMLSKITISLTTFVNNTDNVHVSDLAYYFFYKKVIYTAVRPMFNNCFFKYVVVETLLCNIRTGLSVISW